MAVVFPTVFKYLTVGLWVVLFSFFLLKKKNHGRDSILHQRQSIWRVFKLLVCTNQFRRKDLAGIALPPPFLFFLCVLHFAPKNFSGTNCNKHPFLCVARLHKKKFINLIYGNSLKTTEHYFQAKKFAGTRHEEEIRQSRNPSEAARMGRSRSRPLREDWELVKDRIMLDALVAKFTQHPDLRDLLIGTGLSFFFRFVSRFETGKLQMQSFCVIA